MAAQIAELIDKVDNVELIRDELAAILLVESENQQALAQTANKDPALWKLRIFTERATPWEEFIEAPDGSLGCDTSPLVNVSIDRSEYDKSAGNIIERQRSDTTYHIDCYGYGVSRDTLSGHIPGDESAAREAQRAVRLVRNILMSAHYVDLGHRGLVWDRWPLQAQAFDPADARTVQRVSAVRFDLQVRFNEFSPQDQGQPLELISTQVIRSETGQLLLRADYPL
jgi:hypothetical protein